VPYNAPAALDALAVRYQAEVLRLGRDPDALPLYLDAPEFRDGCFAAVFIAETLKEKGMTLAQLAELAPSFAVRVREVECESDRGKLMRELASSLQGMNRELCQGIKVCLDGTWVHVSPCAARQALRVSAEGYNSETAEELCMDFSERIRKYDKNAVDKKMLHN
jgi:phosphomannomutase